MGVGRELEGLGGMTTLTAIAELPKMGVLMTRHAVCGQIAKADGLADPLGELSDFVNVAGAAFDHGVLALEREARGRMRECRRGERLSIDGVTALAGRAELPKMRVDVTGRTRGRRVGEGPRVDRHPGPRGKLRSLHHMAAHTREPFVLSVEELRGRRVGELRDFKGARRVTAVAGRTQLSLVYINVTRRTRRLRSSKIKDARGEWPGRRDAGMAADAVQSAVPLRERKLRLRRVVERCNREVLFGVTGAARLLKLPLVRVDVAVDALAGLQLDLHRRLHVTRHALQRRVAAQEGKVGDIVVDGLRRPRPFRVTALAG